MYSEIKKVVALSRSLGFISLLFIGLGAIVGGSIVVLIGPLISIAGTLGVIVSLILSILIAMLTALIYAELTSAIPEVGGGYLWAKLTTPRPIPYFTGWINWLSHTLAGTFYALSFGYMLADVIKFLKIPVFINSELLIKLLATAIIIAFSWINYTGVKRVGIAGILIGSFFTVAIFLYICAGIYHGIVFNSIAQAISSYPLPNGLTSLFISMMTAVIAFEGYEILAQAAEEAKAPLKIIPKAVLLTLTIASIMYLGVTISTFGVLGSDSYPLSIMLGSSTVLYAANKLLPLGGLIVGLAGIATILSSINSTIFSSSRVLLAISRAGELPYYFAKINPKYKTPGASIWFTAAIMIVFAFILDITLSAFIDGVLFTLLFIIVNYTAINLRAMYKDRLNYGFLAPFYPFIPVLGLLIKIVLFVAVLVIYPQGTVGALLLIGLGFFLYKGYAFKYEVEHTSPTIIGEGSLVKKDFRVLVVLTREPKMQDVRLASEIAKANDGDITILRVVKLPYHTPLNISPKLLQKDVRILRDLTAYLNEMGVPARFIIKTTHDVEETILMTIESEAASLMIMDTETGARMNRVMNLASCDILLFNPDYPSVTYLRAKQHLFIGNINDEGLVERINDVLKSPKIVTKLVDDKNIITLNQLVRRATSQEDRGVLIFSYSIFKKIRWREIDEPFLVYKRSSMSLDELRKIIQEWRK